MSKGKSTILFYHDSIDAIGDKAKTEHRTFDACKWQCKIFLL